MQQIWLDHSGWDDAVSSKIQDDWLSFQSNFLSINDNKIPRLFGFTCQAKVQFHGFSDASKCVYAAVLYVLLEFEDKVEVHLISSKTR